MRPLLVLILIPLLALAAACGDEGASAGATDAQASQELSVMMRDIAFEPAVIEVERGTLVRLNFENSGILVHDFTIDSMPMWGMRMSGGVSNGGHGDHGAERAMHLALAGGGHGMIEFEATEPGEYIYYCDEPGHRDAGMHGVLRVR